MKIIISFILSMILLIPCAIMVTACDEEDGGNGGHTHTYAATYSYDDTYHWKAANCEHATEKTGYATHEYGEWETQVAATHTTPAIEKRVCACGYKQTRNGDAIIGHTYEGCEYRIISGRAYKVTTCSCGDESKEELTNYIIVDTQNAQSVLDGSQGSINGKTIVFASGTYGSLAIRSTIDTVEKIYEYEYLGNNDYTMETEYTGELSDLEKVGIYHYTRTINNVKFVATNNARFAGVFSVQSKAFRRYGYALDTEVGISDSTIYVDPIRTAALNEEVKVSDIDSDGVMEVGDTAYIDHITFKNVTFENMNFTGSKGRIYLYNRTAEEYENILVNNCSFKTDEAWSYIASNNTEIGAGRAAISLCVSSTPVVPEFKNITVMNCDIDGHYQGVYINNANNALITGNTIKNTICNAISIQDKTKGDIHITYNTVSNVTDRAMIFTDCTNLNLLISNNVFSNCAEYRQELEETQLLFSGALVASNMVFENNTYNGAALADDEQGTDHEDTAFKVLVPNAE